MKNEQVFSEGGFYSFVVETDTLLHSAACEIGKVLLNEIIQKRKTNAPIQVLDLACGSLPVAISEVMASFHGKQLFDYTGIDINPDQVRLLRDKFIFSKNVVNVQVIEDNSWNLEKLNSINEEYDLIFSGLNFHHASPEELYCLAIQLKQKLRSKGIIINHDLYRPNNEKYIKRPDHNLHNKTENLNLLTNNEMSKIEIPDFNFSGTEYELGIPNWRDEFLKKEVDYLLSHGASSDDIKMNVEHILGHDFSVSIEEITKIFDKAGYVTTVHDYDSKGHPLEDYIKIISMKSI